MARYVHSFALFALSTTLLFCEEEDCCIENTNSCCDLHCCVNPPARPFDPNCWGFYLTIDPLIWHAYPNDPSVAVETSQSQSFFNSGSNRIKNLNFNWDWGFRLGVGFNSCHDGWDLLARWTRWTTDGKRTLTAPSSGALYPTRGSPALLQDQFAQEAKATADLYYNVLDLENGREFFVSSCLTLRPFVGLRSAWICYQFDTTYENLTASSTLITQDTLYTLFQADRFWGVGIRGGADLQWGIISEWSLFSNFAGSLIYGYHSIKHFEDPGSPLIGEELNISNFFHTVSGIFDMQLGIRFDTFFCCEAYHLGLDLGWELHWYPNQNHFFNFVDDTMTGKFVSNGGDLGIQGFYFRTRFDF